MRPLLDLKRNSCAEAVGFCGEFFSAILVNFLKASAIVEAAIEKSYVLTTTEPGVGDPDCSDISMSVSTNSPFGSSDSADDDIGGRKTARLSEHLSQTDGQECLSELSARLPPEVSNRPERDLIIVAGSRPRRHRKTSFARALAREANVHFIATSYGQWQAYKEGHLGHMTPAPPPTGLFGSARAREEAPRVDGSPVEPGQARK